MRTDKLKLSPDVPAWAQQPGESTDDYNRFKAYLELGIPDGDDMLPPDRSLEQALEIWNATNPKKRQITLSTIKKISMLNRWTDRVAAYDTLLWQQEYRRQVKLRKEMQNRQRKQGIALQAKGAQVISQIPPGAIGPSDALRFMVEGARMEAAAIGQPTPPHVVQHQGSGAQRSPIEGVETDEWSAQDRRRYLAQLYAEAGSRSGVAPSEEDDDD